MAGDIRTFETVKDVLLTAQVNFSPEDQVTFYNTWAETYDKDVALMDYRAASLAANIISTYFTGDREAALVLDVACGTGKVATQMKMFGFGHFVGLDGSKSMLEKAKITGLYQDVKECILGDKGLPVQLGSFDVVAIAGSLSGSHVSFHVARELCKATKPGGLVCMTCRGNRDNLGYKAALERELKLMEEEGLWSCVKVTEVEEFERGVSQQEEGYISGTVYLYRLPAL